MIGYGKRDDGINVVTSPMLVTQFISDLAATCNPTSVLDPTCGVGGMLKAIQMSCSPDIIQGVDVNQEVSRIAQTLLGEEAYIQQGDIFQSHLELKEQYDLIVADPPLNLLFRGRSSRDHLPKELQGVRLRQFAEYLAIWACRR